jgi:hypothetical protein
MPRFCKGGKRGGKKGGRGRDAKIASLEIKQAKKSHAAVRPECASRIDRPASSATRETSIRRCSSPSAGRWGMIRLMNGSAAKSFRLLSFWRSQRWSNSRGLISSAAATRVSDVKVGTHFMDSVLET